MKPYSLFRIAAALGIVILITSFAVAGEFPRPIVDYSADMEMEMGTGPDGKPMMVTGKIFASGEKERREMAMMGRESIIITRRDQGLTWILMPERKSYMESRESKRKYAESIMREGKVTLTKLGPEQVNGMDTEKYRIEATHEEGGRFNGHLWVTKENVPVRIESDPADVDQHFRVNYKNIQIRKQDPKLFEPPPDYALMTTPGMPGFPRMGAGKMPEGAPPGGMDPEQMEKMQKQAEEMMKQFQKPPGESQ